MHDFMQGLGGILLLLASMVASTTVPGANAASLDPSFVSQARAYLQERAKSPAFSEAVLVVSHGEVVLREAHGMADFELGVPLRPEHVFRIASLTKAFTAAAVLKLRDQRKLELTDSICRFVSNCPSAWTPVTLAHLLRHTSGIPDRFGDLAAVPVSETRAEVDRVLGQGGEIALKTAPGESYAYSNFNYVLLGYAIEIVTGRHWESVLQSEVFAPARLMDTAYDDVWTLVPGRVHGYDVKDGQPRHFPYHDHAAYAAGGLRSTLDDLHRWHQAFLSGAIVSKASVVEALTPGLGNYGYGWEITSYFGKKLHHHTGGLAGFKADISFYHDEQMLIIVLSNTMRANPGGTACDLAALAFGTASIPTGDDAWLQRATLDRCGVQKESRGN